MTTHHIDYKNIVYPPGGILIWVVIFLEVMTFGIALIGLAYYGRQEPEIFHQSRLQLNTAMGAANTVFLLASGFFMANAVHNFKANKLLKTRRFFMLALLGGALFLVVKAFEYSDKIAAGLTVDENMFFTFYWLLTVFHLVHVLVGMVILAIIMRSINKQNAKLEDVEAGAGFWHMCDLVWLLLFPALYLIF